MLTRRAPLKNSGFKRRALPERARPPLTPLTRNGRRDPAITCTQPIAKDNNSQHEGYRRLVAAMACISCWIEGRSNHAHRNTGKPKGGKTDCRYGFPLCVDQPGEEGCHTRHDQRRLFPGLTSEQYAALEDEWGRRTRLSIINAGLWPAGLERIE